jgi:flavin reductase (DIM6/NTAB) family NADH-FMN oxidoreductase RutF
MALRHFAATVTVISTRTRSGSWVGMTATAVSSLSFEPPSLLFCTHRLSHLLATTWESGIFCVNVLGSGHQQLAANFGSTAPQAHHFAPDEWRAGRADLPLVIAARANLFSEIAEVHEFGGHSVIIGVVKDVRVSGTGTPLIYLEGSYLP